MGAGQEQSPEWLRRAFSEAIDEALEELGEDTPEQILYWRSAGVERVQELLVEKGVLRPEEVRRMT